MELSKEEFDQEFRESLDFLLEEMAENSAIDVDRFYGMACFLENLAFFSPVFYGLIEQSKK